MEASSHRPLSVALSLIFFLSGGASLLFETLWFRLCGLVFGNSAWASAIVLTSFMAGLAIGNMLSTRFVRRWSSPLRAYAGLEITIGTTGILLVLLLPLLPSVLAPLFRPLMDSALLNGMRLLFAFLLLLLPATVMGATLPAVVSALSRRDPNFGRVLGLLYGCNTIGAVAGALAGEMLLVRLFGVRGTGVVAALCSCTAGLAALYINRWYSGTLPAAREPKLAPMPWRFLGAACGAGFALLALEVIWFRFVILFVISTSLAFAVMLAIVLAGIGLGALIASAILGRFPDADAYAPVVAAAAAATLVLTYSGFVPWRAETGGPARYETVAVLVDSIRLMLPVSILSGIFFTAIGRSVERVLGDETRAAAAATFANTIGAAIGPLVAGFFLIPSIGVEGSFFVIAILYVVVAALSVRAAAPRLALAGAGLLAVVTLAFFPFHLFRNYFLPNAVRQFAGSRIVAVREGVTETAVYLQRDFAEQPFIYRLFTNGYSMSGTTFPSRRYMSAFVYIPMALRPDAHNALLISYGVGITAKTLMRTRQLQSIDVVDISKNILDLGSIVWPGTANPLADPRAHVHVEDGRFFLLTTPRRFDLITAEPPPPKSAGIVNLYTREHFQLMHDRLTDRGIASYWLPVYQLSESDSKSIIRGFCDVFADCSLWTGAGAEWILVGSRGSSKPPAYADFARQWHDPVAAEHLIRVGIETPEQLAALFLADAPMLHQLTAGSPPLTDNHPLRLTTQPPTALAPMIFHFLNGAPDAFVRSSFVKTALPPEAIAGAPRYFASQRIIDRVLLIPIGNTPPPSIPELRWVLTSTNLRALPRLLFGSDAFLEDIAVRLRAKGDKDASLAYIAAVGALGDRDYRRAAELFAEARKGMPEEKELPSYQALAASLAR